MFIRLIGAGILCLGSVYVGFSAAGSVRKTAKDLQQLKLALEMMRCEVSYALTPIGTVCEIVSRSCTGEIRQFFELARTKYVSSETVTEHWVSETVGRTLHRLPNTVREAITELFTSFGRFGADEQLRLIDLTIEKTEAAIKEVDADRAQRCKCYRTLGICTGLAVAVLVL